MPNCTQRYKSRKVQKLQKVFWNLFMQEQMKKGGLEKNAFQNFNKGFKKGFMDSCKKRNKTLKK